MHNFPYTVFTSGWYQIGWSAEFAAGDVRPMRYFETELVAFRDRSGAMHVMGAVCPHLGAHLGHGGVLEGDCLVCPFHGWKFGPDGRNVEVPYSSPDRMDAGLPQWSVAEVDGLVLLWYGATGEGPTWQPPRFVASDLSAEDDFWAVFPGCTAVWRDQRFPPHLPAENGCDAAHFNYVHGAVDVPELVSFEADGPRFRCEYTAVFGGHRPTTWATPTGPVTGHLTTESHGLGFTKGTIESFDTVHTLQATTPIDMRTSDHRATVWVPRTRGDGSPMEEKYRDRWANQQVVQHAADLPIWENSFYLDKPLYTRSESRVFRAFRQWADELYAAAGDARRSRRRSAG